MVTDSELTDFIQRRRADTDAAVKDTLDKVGKAIEASEQIIHDAVERNGRQVCPGCNGYGAVQRLDAGYMRKFGLREWDGCSACGGTRETKGRGFVERV